jgi:hypothetical protein
LAATKNFFKPLYDLSIFFERSRLASHTAKQPQNSLSEEAKAPLIERVGMRIQLFEAFTEAETTRVIDWCESEITKIGDVSDEKLKQQKDALQRLRKLYEVE